MEDRAGGRALAPRLPTVVLVERDARERVALRLVLEAFAAVVEASDGEQALRTLQERAGRAVDLVLIEHEIPGRSGLEVLRQATREWPWIPVAIITGYSSEELAIEALRAGARDYLKKPVGVRDLERVLTHVRTGRRPVEPLPRAAHSGIGRALAFVREHFTEPLTLAQVAREAGLSKFHFCRLFRRHAGLSFLGYVHRLRIDRAKALLADRRMTVTEVAHATGFDDLSHFDNVFNRIVGVCPTGYRRAIRSA